MSGARQVVVVGGGVAGLAAGFACARRGDSAVVLESAARAGGRAAPDEHGEEPWLARVTTADAALLALVRASGCTHELLPVRPVPSAIASGRSAVAIVASGLPRPGALAGVSWLAALRTARLDRLGVRYAKHLDPAAPERAAPLDDRSIADFATLYFGRGAAAGWIEPWLAERAPADAANTSRAAFLLRWQAERAAVAGSLGGPLARLIDAIVRRVEVRTSARVEHVEPKSGGGFRVATASESLDAEALVLAVPAPEALRIAGPVLVAAERDVLGAVQYDAAIAWRAPARDASLALRVRSAPLGAGPLASIAIEGGRVVAVARDPWATSRLGVADDVVEKEIAGVVEALLPGVIAGTGQVRRFPLAWPRFDVGRIRGLARLRAVEADRRAAGRALRWAGDFTSAPTLEGAVRSAGFALEAFEGIGDRDDSSTGSQRSCTSVTPAPPASGWPESKRST